MRRVAVSAQAQFPFLLPPQSLVLHFVRHQPAHFAVALAINIYLLICDFCAAFSAIANLQSPLNHFSGHCGAATVRWTKGILSSCTSSRTSSPNTKPLHKGHRCSLRSSVTQSTQRHCTLQPSQRHVGTSNETPVRWRSKRPSPAPDNLLLHERDLLYHLVSPWHRSPARSGCC
jgi:hypothetical protein